MSAHFHQGLYVIETYKRQSQFTLTIPMSVAKYNLARANDVDTTRDAGTDLAELANTCPGNGIYAFRS